MFSKTLFDDPFEKFRDGSEWANGSVASSERGEFVRMSIHNVASFQAVGMYPILSEKVESLARWM